MSSSRHRDDDQVGAVHKIDTAANLPRRHYISTNMSCLHSSQEKLIEITRLHRMCNMQTNPDQLTLFSNMIKFAGAKKCIDIGVFTGLSSLTMALSIPEDGKVVALDVSEEFTNIGKPVWEEARVAHKIDLRIAPASESLEAMIANGEANSYDFVYIDADKSGYDRYYEQALTLLRPNGIVAVDNVWWHGRVVDETHQDMDTVAIRNINNKIKVDARVEAVMIDSGDGVYICRKK